jgi:hypothetical protein
MDVSGSSTVVIVVRTVVSSWCETGAFHRSQIPSGELTTDQARQVAAMLVEAADELEALG